MAPNTLFIWALLKSNHVFFLFHAISCIYGEGRDNIILRHSVRHSPPNFLGIACWLVELNAAACLAKKLKKIIPTSDNRIQNRPDTVTHYAAARRLHMLKILPRSDF